jgi:hypothetical protein
MVSPPHSVEGTIKAILTATMLTVICVLGKILACVAAWTAGARLITERRNWFR